MSKKSLLRRLFSWQSLSVIVTMGFASIGLVFAYISLQEPESRVVFETISDTDVLDLRRPLQDLSIVFRGQDVQEQGLNLRIVTVNIANTGEVNILPGHYDLQDDWGMRFRDAEIVEARLVDASSQYLLSRVVPQRLGADAITFPKIILEKRSSFAIEVLLLHAKTVSPSITSIGKIAGVDEITVLTRPLTREDSDLFTEAFQGRAMAQAVRIIAYSGGTLIVIAVAVVVAAIIAVSLDGWRTSRRRNNIQKTKTIRDLDTADVRNFLVEQYVAHGFTGIKDLQKLIGEPQRIEWVNPPARWQVRDRLDSGDLLTTEYPYFERPLVHWYRDLDTLVNLGTLKKGDDDSAVIDPRFREMIDSLLAELEK